MSETTYSSGIVTLDNVVEEYLMIGRRPRSEYKVALQCAIRGFMDLRLHAVRAGVKVTKEDVSSINRVDFPSDFVDFVSIGVAVNGKVWMLSPNNDFILTTTTTAGVEGQDSDSGEGVEIPNETSQVYTARGGSNSKGYYNIEWDKRRIALINVDESEVILAYKTTGASLDGTTYIPVHYVMAMNAFMDWWSKALNPNVAVSQKQIAKQEYLRLRQELRHMQYKLTDWEHAIYRTTYPGPKR